MRPLKIGVSLSFALVISLASMAAPTPEDWARAQAELDQTSTAWAASSEKASAMAEAIVAENVRLAAELAPLQAQLAAVTAERDALLAAVKKIDDVLKGLTVGVMPPGDPATLAANVARWESFTGEPSETLGVFASMDTWTTTQAQFGAVGTYWVPRWAKVDRPKVVTFGLGPKPINPTYSRVRQDINSGKKDAEFRREFTALAAAGLFVVRLGHECNGDWYEWSESAVEYVKAWRRVVGIARAIDQRFRFVWNVNAYSRDIMPFYPGATWVDEISFDLYRKADGDPFASFVAIRDHVPAGLNTILALALREGKAVSIDELGAVAGQGVFLDLLAAYIRDRQDVTWKRVVYWDRTDGIPTAISDGASGTTGNAWLRNFRS